MRTVGRENVIAGAGRGFGTFAGSDEIDESVVWAKFESLVRRSADRFEAALGARRLSGRRRRSWLQIAEPIRSDLFECFD